MWSFQYKHGDRPLEGYTIQRAAGRGGFGEVYYAVSDSGREVALKVVQGYEQIELRGISQCMNLKSPHLVSIFDVRHNAENKPFVIMEYVSGPSLRQLLDESPSGLGEQKSAFFLREIAKGLTFLHDCGIVHRDLKPGNIFYENGYVKIGDYGLSKAISTGVHSGQTVTVGTVHYMAPEIGVGKYDRSIDIYALGTVLYEMLTGTVPFVGASPSEILMKHLSAEPDCAGIAEPFSTVIKRAMHKDPSRRYQSVQEMVEAVFGAEHVRNSMSVFSAEDLSMVAGRVAQKLAIGTGSGGSGPAAGGAPAAVGSSSVTAKPQAAAPGGRFQDRVNRRVAQWSCGNDSDAIDGVSDDLHEAIANDPMAPRDRWMLALLTSVLVAVAAGMLSTRPEYGWCAFLASWGGTLGLTWAWRWGRRWGTQGGGRRWLVGAVAFAAALTIAGGGAMLNVNNPAATFIAVGAAFVLCDTGDWVSGRRKERVSLGAAVKAGLVAWIATWFLGGHAQAMLSIAIVGATALMAQVLAPWTPHDLRRERDNHPASPGDAPNAPPPAPGVAPTASFDVGGRQAQAYAVTLPGGSYDDPASDSAAPIGKPVPHAIRIVWMIVSAATLTLGLMLLIAVGARAFDRGDEPVAVAFGVASLVASLFCFTRMFKRTSVGWWGYFLKPVMLLLCVQSILISSIILANTHRLMSDEKMIGTFFIIFPAVVMLMLMFVPSVLGRSSGVTVLPPPAPPRSDEVSPYKRLWAAILCGLCFFGPAGIQRFYVGKVGTGILWLMTWGLCGIGQLVDFIRIMNGTWADGAGRRLLRWDDEPVPSPAGAQPQAQWQQQQQQQGGGAQYQAQGQGQGQGQGQAQGAAAREPFNFDWLPPQVNDHVNNAVRIAMDAKDLGLEKLKELEKLKDLKELEKLKHLGGRWDERQRLREIRRRERDLARRQWRRESRWQRSSPGDVVRAATGGMFAAIASVLIFVALAQAVALTLDLPGFIAAGLPDPHFTKDVETKIFGYPEWPDLARRIGAASVGITMLLGVAAMMFARRRAGSDHMARGVIAIGGMLIALIPISRCIPVNTVWEEAAPLFQTHRIGPGVDLVLSHFQNTWAPYMSGGIFLLSVILLAWPDRRVEQRAAGRVGPTTSGPRVVVQPVKVTPPSPPPAPPPPTPGSESSGVFASGAATNDAAKGA